MAKHRSTSRVASIAALAGLFVVTLATAAATPRKGAPRRDAHPLPQDTLMFRDGEAGVYGGRFIIAATTSPRTFNPFLSNEQSSNDVIGQLYAGLAELDNATGAITRCSPSPGR